jgi:hypothetical protein
MSSASESVRVTAINAYGNSGKRLHAGTLWDHGDGILRSAPISFEDRQAPFRFQTEVDGRISFIAIENSQRGE